MQQADRRARVAAVERARPPPAGPRTRRPATRGLVARQRDVDAQRAQRRRRRQVVAAPPEPARLDDAVARAPRTAARGARSTCRPGTRQVPRSGPERRTVQRGRVGGHRLLHYHIAARDRRRSRRSSPAPASTASSFSASPSRLSAPMCRRTWTRDPSAATRQAVEHRREPEQHDHLLARVRARGVGPDRRRRGRVAAAVEQRQRRPGPGRRRGPAGRRSGAGRRGRRAPRRRARACRR